MNIQHISTVSESFGERLRRLRDGRGLTLRELASALGVSAPAVSKWEHGSSKPRPRLRSALAEALAVSEAELFSDSRQDQFGAALSLAIEESVSRQICVELEAGQKQSLPETVMDAKEKIAEAAGTTPDQVTITIAI